MERSIAGQVEFWARLGRAIDPVINGAQAIAINQRARAQSLAELLAAVDQPAGQQRLDAHLAVMPFPHYAAHATLPGVIERFTADGVRTAGRFVRRAFVPLADAP